MTKEEFRQHVRNIAANVKDGEPSDRMGSLAKQLGSFDKELGRLCEEANATIDRLIQYCRDRQNG